MAAFTLNRMYVNAAGTLVGAAWTPGDVDTRPTSTVGSDIRQGLVSENFLLYGLNNVLCALGGGDVAMTTSIPSIGTTVTVACQASVISVNAVAAVVAAETAKAFGSLGTIPASTWGLICLERILDGTTSFVSAAANYTTGYASEEAALAALPAQSSDKVMTGLVTILASGSDWVAGTDALEGGTGGNPATTTNYYGIIGAADVTTGPWAATFQVASKTGVITSTAG